MARGITSVAEDTPARDIASIMCDKNIKRVPVLRDGKLVGIVARSDLVRALADKLQELRATPRDAAEHSINAALRRGREKTTT
jgi:CBS domain-containing protein